MPKGRPRAQFQVRATDEAAEILLEIGKEMEAGTWRPTPPGPDEPIEHESVVWWTGDINMSAVLRRLAEAADVRLRGKM